MATERVDIVVRERGAARAGKNIRGVGKAAGTAAKGVRLLGAALAGIGVALGVRELLGLADTFTSINNAIKLVTDSTESLVRVQRALFAVSQETRTGLEANAVLFRRLAFAAEDLGATEEELISLTRTVGQTVAISGASAEGARAGLLQFSQSLAGGVVRAEEFNSILEQIPFLARTIATGLGVSIGKLRQLVIAGELSSREVLEALEKQGDAVDKTFSTLTPTLSQSFTVLQNALLQSVGTIDQVLGSSDALSVGIIDLSENLDEFIVQGVAKLIRGFGDVVDVVADVVEVIEFLGLDFDAVARQFALLQKIAVAVFASIEFGFQKLRVVVLALVSGLALVGNALGVISDEEVERRTKALSSAIESLKTSGRAAGNALGELQDQLFTNIKATFDFDDTNQTASEGLRKFGANARATAADLDKLAESQEKVNAAQAPPGKEPIPVLGGELPRSAAEELFTDPDAFKKSLEFLDLLIKSDELQEGGEDAGTTFGDAFAGTAASAIGSVFSSLLQGEAVDFADVLADVAGQALSKSLESVLSDVGSQLAGLFGGGGGGAAGGAGGGANISQGIGATIGAIGLLASGFAGTKANVRTGLAKSAATSVTETRGLIAGPSNVPIAQVGDDIADAFVPVVEAERESNRLLAGILAAVRAQGTGSSAAAMLDEVMTAELNTSTSLA